MAIVKHLKRENHPNLMGTIILFLSFLSFVCIECTSGEFEDDRRMDETKYMYNHIRDMVCIIGEECIMDCPVSAPENESVTINWSYWVTDLKQQGRRLNVTIMKRSSVSDERYICKIIMSNGTKDEFWFKVHVYENRESVPFIVDGPHDHKMTLGGSTEFTCVTHNASVTWLHDGKIIKPGYDFGMIGKYLRIHNVTENLFGNYTCVAKSAREAATSSAFLFTEERWDDAELGPEPMVPDNDDNSTPPIEPFFIIDMKPKSTVVVMFAKYWLRLSCPAGGNPRPNIAWLKDGKPMNPEFAMVNYGNWSMSIQGWMPQDSGNYTCIVCNEMGCINSTYDVTIVDREPYYVRGHIKEGYPRNVTADVGSVAPFSCPSDSKSYVNTRWIKSTCAEIEHSSKMIYKNRSRILSEEKDYKIVNVTKEHGGWYSCVLENRCGEICKSAYLKVANV